MSDTGQTSSGSAEERFLNLKKGQLEDTGSLRALFLAERRRRQTIQGQMSAPISVITFASFGYVSLGSNLDFTYATKLTYMIMYSWTFSFFLAVVAVVLLAAVEVQYLRLDLADFEDRAAGESEKEYFRDCYTILCGANHRAERLRALALLLLLISVSIFLAAILLVPLQ